jgi:acyloxyacyl hydrolase
MTKPEVFYSNVVETMEYLDKKLPNGSHVLLTGLGNGTYLYGLLSDRIHPMGRLRQDVTYRDFYEYLTCLEVYSNKKKNSKLFSQHFFEFRSHRVTVG